MTGAVPPVAHAASDWDGPRQNHLVSAPASVVEVVVENAGVAMPAADTLLTHARMRSG
jgi:hypothetical protein